MFSSANCDPAVTVQPDTDLQQYADLQFSDSQRRGGGTRKFMSYFGGEGLVRDVTEFESPDSTRQRRIQQLWTTASVDSANDCVPGHLPSGPRTSPNIKLTALGTFAVKTFWVACVTFRVEHWLTFTELNRAKYCSNR
jgi:hypothetical protein